MALDRKAGGLINLCCAFLHEIPVAYIEYGLSVHYSTSALQRFRGHDKGSAKPSARLIDQEVFLVPESWFMMLWEPFATAMNPVGLLFKIVVKNHSHRRTISLEAARLIEKETLKKRITNIES